MNEPVTLQSRRNTKSNKRKWLRCDVCHIRLSQDTCYTRYKPKKNYCHHHAGDYL